MYNKVVIDKECCSGGIFDDLFRLSVFGLCGTAGQEKGLTYRSYGLVFWIMNRAEKEVSMKITYVAPEVELSVLDTEDVVMISGLTIKEQGSLTETNWSDLT